MVSCKRMSLSGDGPAALFLLLFLGTMGGGRPSEEAFLSVTS
jgi:hypothetical protein